MNALLALAGAAALAEWILIATGRRRLEYIAKPAVLVFLTLWFWQSAPTPLPFAARAMLAGLGLSLIGDVILLLPQDPFVVGLAAFLCAHLGYIAAFNAGGISWQPQTLVLALALAGLATLSLLGLRRGLKTRGRGALFPAVAAYGVVLAGMAWSAGVTLWKAEWPLPAAILASLGGILFFVSDLSLAWTKYVRPVPGQRLTVMVTYHLAQLGLAWGMLIHLSA